MSYGLKWDAATALGTLCGACAPGNHYLSTASAGLYLTAFYAANKTLLACECAVFRDLACRCVTMGTVVDHKATEGTAEMLAPVPPSPPQCVCDRREVALMGCKCPGGKAELERERAARKAREVNMKHYA